MTILKLFSFNSKLTLKHHSSIEFYEKNCSTARILNTFYSSSSDEENRGWWKFWSWVQQWKRNVILPMGQRNVIKHKTLRILTTIWKILYFYHTEDKRRIKHSRNCGKFVDLRYDLVFWHESGWRFHIADVMVKEMMRLHQIYDSLRVCMRREWKRKKTSWENCHFNRNYAQTLSHSVCTPRVKIASMQKDREQKIYSVKLGLCSSKLEHVSLRH